MRESDNKILWQYGLSFIGLLCMLGVFLAWGLTRQKPLLGMLFFLAVGCCVAVVVYWRFGRHIDDAIGAMRGERSAAPALGIPVVKKRSKDKAKPRDTGASERRLARRQQARRFYKSTYKHPTPEGVKGMGKNTAEQMAFQADAAKQEALALLHRWVRIKFSSDETVLAFVFIDGDAGLTAKGDVISSFPKDAELRRVREKPTRTIQLEPLYAWEVELLPKKSRDTYQLPRLPDWYDQKASDRDPSRFFLQDPLLGPMFNPTFPGDVQVQVFDGGPHRSEVPPEAVWVRVIGRPWPMYVGIVRNTPKAVQSVSLGDQIMFAIRPEQDLPFLITDAYYEERERWSIIPCGDCGLDELFDCPSELLLDASPRADLTRAAFATSCPVCGGRIEVRSTPTTPRTR